MNSAHQQPSADLLPIVVFANREDFWFTKICVASIRYYYPEVPIYLAKDNLNGRFSTGTFRKKFNVQLVDLGKPYYGWGAAKMLFLVDEKLPRGRYLLLDSDIILTGAVLEGLVANKADFVVHGERHVEPFPEKTKDTYFHPEEIIKLYPEYKYPGFFFNTGQMVVTPGLIDKDKFVHCFDFARYPYYRNRPLFPLVDQSVLNCVLPMLADEQKLTLSGTEFMAWSGNFFEGGDKDDPEKLKDPMAMPYVLHYAGDVRTHRIEKMRGKNLLAFFKDQYMQRLSPWQRTISEWQDRWYAKKQLNRVLNKRNRLYMKYLPIG